PRRSPLPSAGPGSILNDSSAFPAAFAGLEQRIVSFPAHLQHSGDRSSEESEVKNRKSFAVAGAFRVTRGFTLIELAVYLNLAVLLGVPLIMITLTSSR